MSRDPKPEPYAELDPPALALLLLPEAAAAELPVSLPARLSARARPPDRGDARSVDAPPAAVCEDAAAGEIGAALPESGPAAAPVLAAAPAKNEVMEAADDEAEEDTAPKATLSRLGLEPVEVGRAIGMVTDRRPVAALAPSLFPVPPAAAAAASGPTCIAIRERPCPCPCPLRLLRLPAREACDAADAADARDAVDSADAALSLRHRVTRVLGSKVHAAAAADATAEAADETDAASGDRALVGIPIAPCSSDDDSEDRDSAAGEAAEAEGDAAAVVDAGAGYVGDAALMLALDWPRSSSSIDGERGGRRLAVEPAVAATRNDDAAEAASDAAVETDAAASLAAPMSPANALPPRLLLPRSLSLWPRPRGPSSSSSP